jgi:hypothetical protein
MRTTLACLIISISFGLCMLPSAHSEQAPLTFDEQHTRCEHDSDCTVFSVKCSCECGTALNAGRMITAGLKVSAKGERYGPRGRGPYRTDAKTA